MGAPVEEASGVAKSAIEALKGSPSCLAAIIFACILALLTYFALRDEQSKMHERSMLLISKCFNYDHESHPHEEGTRR